MMSNTIGTGLESLDELLGGGLPIRGAVGIVGPRSHQLARQMADHAVANGVHLAIVNEDETSWIDVVHGQATANHIPDALLLVGKVITQELRRWSDLILQLEDWDPDLPFVRLFRDHRVLGPGTHLGWLPSRRVFVSLRVA